MGEEKSSDCCPAVTAPKGRQTQSMQFRILATIIFAMLAITVFIGGISIYEVDKYVQAESANFVEVTCANEVAQINAVFGDMEKSVNIMESYVMGFFTEGVDVDAQMLQQTITNSADVMFANVARQAELSPIMCVLRRTSRAARQACFTARWMAATNTSRLSRPISRFTIGKIPSMSAGSGSLMMLASPFG